MDKSINYEGAELRDREHSAEFQLGVIIDLYKHHHELAVKASTFFLVAVGFISGYIFRPEVTPVARAALSGMVAVGAVLHLVACYAAKRWFRRIDSTFNTLKTDLRFAEADLLGQGFNSVFVAELAAWIVLTCSVLLTAFFLVGLSTLTK